LHKKKDQIEVFCKHNRELSISFPTRESMEEAAGTISALAFPASVKQLFAFAYNKFDVASPPVTFTIEEDYERLGLLDAKTLRTLDNSDFSYCDTYPSTLIVPSSINDEIIRAVCSFRSRSRIPCAVWKHPDNGALIVRCAQPCVGLTGNHCSADEQMIGAYKNSQQKEIYILDSRPKTNAIANMLRGGGYEISKFYKDIQLEFNNIDNIHVMRNSLSAVHKFCSSLPLEATKEEVTEENQPEALQESHWLAHLRLVLISAARVVELVHSEACSVIVHCSDGWDRTSQTVALAELLLDPYYRTLEGLLRLIEKDWVQFGHQFALRYGHEDNTMWNYKESQRSPIFPQFLDLLHQLIHIYPTKFEFNEVLLLTLMEELYSCRYGNFLYNSHKQRLETDVASSTKSIWSFILLHRDFFTNPDYQADPSILLLELSSIQLRLWTNYFINFQRLGPPQVPEIVSEEKEVKPKKKSKSKRSKRTRLSTSSAGNQLLVQSNNKKELNPTEHKVSLAQSATVVPVPLQRRKKKKGSATKEGKKRSSTLRRSRSTTADAAPLSQTSSNVKIIFKDHNDSPMPPQRRKSEAIFPELPNPSPPKTKPKAQKSKRRKPKIQISINNTIEEPNSQDTTSGTTSKDIDTETVESVSNVPAGSNGINTEYEDDMVTSKLTEVPANECLALLPKCPAPPEENGAVDHEDTNGEVKAPATPPVDREALDQQFKDFQKTLQPENDNTKELGNSTESISS